MRRPAQRWLLRNPRRLLSTSRPRATAAPRAAATALASAILHSQRSDFSARHYEALLRIVPPEDIAAVEQRAAASMHTDGLRPLLRPLVGAYSAAGQRGDALRLLRTHRPDAASFDPLLLACVAQGADEDLRAAYWLMRDVGVSPSADTYGELIRARVFRGEADRALRVCVHALDAGHPPPPAAVDDLYESLIAAGLTGSALDLAETLRVRHGRRLESGERATHLLLDGAANSSVPLESLFVLRVLSQHHDEAATPGLAADLLQRCVRANNVNAARALARECDALGIPLGAESRDALLLALLEREALSDAFAHAAPLLGGRDDHRVGDRPTVTAASSPSPSASALGLVLDLRGLPEGAAVSCPPDASNAAVLPW
jgi:hypothetical protein